MSITLINFINNKKVYHFINTLKSSKGDLSITELSQKSGINLVTINSYLKTLKSENLIFNSGFRDKRFKFFNLNEEKLNSILNFCENEDNVFLKAYLLSNNKVMKIISLLKGSDLTLNEINMLLKNTSVSNTYLLMKYLVLSELVSKKDDIYKLNEKILIDFIKKTNEI